MAAVAPVAEIPRRLGKYELVMPLAAGGMARIYIAKTGGIAGFERHVVLKLILPERMHDQNAVNMFLDEARLAASLNHHNVAQVFEVGNDAGVHYLAMEYVHGQDLRALLAKAGSIGRRVPLELGLTIVAAAAAGLHHAHERRGPDGNPLNIVHRDVSPSNIMLGHDGAVKVLDFGIAKAEARSVETQAGMIKGKFAYMSPEQCRGKDVDRRSDVFALGIILYEATTQHRCFRADSDFDTMHRVVTGDVVKPSKVVPGYPPALEAIVLKALALDPAARYQTAGLMLEAIEAYAKASRTVMSTVTLGRFMHDLFGEVAEPWVTDAPQQVVPKPEGTVSNVDRAVTQRPGSIPEIVEDDGSASPRRPLPMPQVAVAAPAVPPTLLEDTSLPRQDEDDDDDDAWERAKSYPVVSKPSVASSATIGPGAGLKVPIVPVVPAPAEIPAPPAAPTSVPRVLPLAPQDDGSSSAAMTALRLPSMELPRLAPPLASTPVVDGVTLAPRRRTGLWIAIVLVLLGGGAAAFVLLGKKDPSAAPTGGAQPGSAAAVLPTADARPPERVTPDAADKVAVTPADAAPVPATVDAGSGAPAVVAAEVRFEIRSTPSGAEVFEAGKLLGETPFEMMRSPRDVRVQLVIRQRGYADELVKLDGKVGGSATVRLRKKDTGGGSEPKPPDVVKPPRDCRKLGEPTPPGQTPKPLC